MSEFAPKELELAEQFAKDGRYADSLQILNDFEQKKGISSQDLVLCHLYKSYLFIYQSLYMKAVDFAEETFKESLQLENRILTLDALLTMAHAFLNNNNIEEGKKKIKQGEELLENLSEIPETIKKRRIAQIFYLKGMSSDPLFSSTGEPDIALEHFQRSLSLSEALNDKERIIGNLIRMSWITGFNKEDFDLALDYLERALVLSREEDYKRQISWAYLIKGAIFSIRGEISQCIQLNNSGLSIAKKFNHILLISTFLNNLAEVYRMTGDLDRALECSIECIEIISNTGNLRSVAIYYDNLIQILIEKGDLEQAGINLNKLEQIKNQFNDRNINEIYLFNKASILKESSRISNQGKAEEIFKQILQDSIIQWDIKMKTLLALSELLLSELKMTGDIEVLTELKSIITQLLNIAEISRSYWAWGETYLLQSKIALIELEFGEARRLMTQGQQVAEKYGLRYLAMKISREHDELLKQSSAWENFKQSKASLTDRMRLARLNEQMEGMIKRRVVEEPKHPEETPVLFLIVSEGGTPLFSQSFIEDQSFEDHLIGGFLSAFNSFVDEMFSGELDRASFGEYTLLINSISPFFMCYIFKGQSYSAQHRLRYFLEKLKNDDDVWIVFEKYYKTNQEIQLKDVPTLEPLIQDIFIDQTTLISE